MDEYDGLDIINVQTTSDFCNKKYIVISTRVYTYLKGVYRNYTELFFDLNKKIKGILSSIMINWIFRQMVLFRLHILKV